MFKTKRREEEKGRGCREAQAYECSGKRQAPRNQKGRRPRHWPQPRRRHDRNNRAQAREGGAGKDQRRTRKLKQNKPATRTVIRQTRRGTGRGKPSTAGPREKSGGQPMGNSRNEQLKRPARKGGGTRAGKEREEARASSRARREGGESSGERQQSGPKTNSGEKMAAASLEADG